MKTFSEREAQDDLERVLEAAQHERVVITRDGRPTALVLGLESYDAEDIRLASLPELWMMIEQRRHEGSAITLGEARSRLEARVSAAPTD